MLKFDLVLANTLERRATNDAAVIMDILNQTNLLSATAKLAMFGKDYDLRTFEQYPRIKQSLIDAATHAAWYDFFAACEAHNELRDREYTAAVSAYTFADYNKRSYYAEVKQLTPFTAEAAQKWFAAHIADTPARRHVTLTNMLAQCGSDWRKSPTKFSSKMTVRGFDAYSDRTKIVGAFMQLACELTDVCFTWNAYWSSVRNNRRIDGERFELVEGLHNVTIELHQNGNATMRIGAALVQALNIELEATK